jgi:hypothetical protein
LDEDAIFCNGDGSAPLKAFGIVEQVQAINLLLRIGGGANEVEAQAATAGQFAGERR